MVDRVRPLRYLPLVSPAELMVFSQSFPFGHGETFLASEVPYLAERFPRARVVPFVIPQGEGDTSLRSLPSGWSLDRSLDAVRRQGRWLPSGGPALAAAVQAQLGAPFAFPTDAVRPGPMRFAYRLTRRVMRFLRTAAWVRRWMQGAGFSQPILAYSYWFEAVAFGLAVAKLGGQALTLVARAHNWDLYEGDDHERTFPFRAATLRTFDRVLPVSEHGVTHLQSRFGASADGVGLARLGVEPSASGPPSVDGVIRVTSCSYLIPRKRLDRLIEMLRSAAQKAPDCRFHWRHIGDGPERDRLQRLAQARLPSSGQVTVEWMGRQPHAEVLRLLATTPIDVFVNVSEREGVPVSIMEALAASVPVLASRAGGTSEIVDDTVGAIVEPWTPTVAAEALLRIGDPDLNAQLRTGARARWRERCSAPVQFRAFAHELAALASSDEPPDRMA